MDQKIRSTEVSLGKTRASGRRNIFLFLVYTGLAYVLAILYVFLYPRDRRSILLDGLGLLGAPFGIYFGRRALAWAYRRRTVSLEAKLKDLRAEQRLKVEELKKKTAYYRTKGLLDRFDPDASSTAKHEPKEAKAEPKAKPPTLPPVAPIVTSPIPHAMPQAMHPPRPMRAPQPVAASPTWIDRLMDTMIGDDRMSKFALICPKCFAHNGLVPSEELETTQYTCPNCKTFVPARRPSSRPISPGAQVSRISSSSSLIIDDLAPFEASIETPVADESLEKPASPLPSAELSPKEIRQRQKK